MLQKKFLKTCFTLLFFIASAGLVKAQRLDSLLLALDSNYMQEKIHVQFDKVTYNPGETIWFKAYIVTDNLPGAISKTVYADLLDENGNILQRKMMPVILSGASSNFDLPDSIKATRLFFRAYTKWMLNFDSSLLYTKAIQYLPAKNPLKKPAVPVAYSLQFFPEGGDLVETINSRVAFKATDNQGQPVKISGDILTGAGKKITTFSAVHDGMGYFELTPVVGEKYKAWWKDKKGVVHENPLPVALKNGAVLSTNLEGNILKYTISRPDSTVDDLKTFFVVAQMEQRLRYSARINLSRKTTITAPIATDSMPNGVLQLTIFNAEEVPVAERLVFINHDNYYFITDLHATETNLAKRGRNGLQIDVGDVLLTNLSIAVTDAGVNPITKNEENIYSALLLTSDLKGRVYNPAYYFSSQDDSVKSNLDLVMMTNGWRRFKWEDLIAGKFPVIKNYPENYLSISGKILGLKSALLYNKDLTGIFKTKTGENDFFSMKIDKDGSFTQENLYFFDTALLHYQLNNDKDKTLTTSATFTFENNFIKAPISTTTFLASLNAPLKEDSLSLVKSSTMAALQRAQVESNRVKTLSTVTVRAKQKSLKEKLDEEYTSGFFSGGDGYTFTTEDDPFAKSATSVLVYLQGKVAGLQINTAGVGSATWRGSTPSFFVNEMNLNGDLSSLQSVNMNDVAMIKVFRPPFFGAAGGGSGGAIAVYTKKGAANNSNVTGLPSTVINGYSTLKEFYSPDYETNPNTDVKDYRTTLYWNPIIFFDKNTRRVVLPFFNSDNCKKMRVVIEGINELGQLTHEERIIE